MKTKFLILTLFVSIFLGCKDGGRTLPSATGSRFELLVVIEDDLWRSEPGQLLFDLFDRDVEAMPQPEPMMYVKHVKNVDFTNMLKPTRNVLYTEVSEKYTQTKLIYSKDHYSYPQAYVRIVAPNKEALVTAIKQNGDDILNYFNVSERERSIVFNKKDLNLKAVNEIKEIFDIRIDVPLDLKRSVKGKDFYWITNDNARIRQDLIVYSYPYTDPNTFSYEYLTAKRDSVVAANIPGETEGSYMGTEYKFIEPKMREITVNGDYAAEIKGLWKILNGTSMGGPYYSLTRLDHVHQRVVTVEGFVFAPGTKKRNAIRLLEAVVHSMRLSQEENVIAEVSVTAKSTEKEEKNTELKK